MSGQLKEYSIPAERGVIEAHDGSGIVPIVLNEEVYTLFADPVYVKDKKAAADAISRLIGGRSEDYLGKMEADTRYAVLAKRLDANQKKAIEDLEYKGIGLRAESIRTYPQGSLASQILGFVNDEGEGTYGIEQALNDKLAGTPGQLKAITDVKGVPLVSNRDNILRDPESGERLRLTIDIGMQKKVEDLLRDHLPTVNSKSGSVVVLDPSNGEIKAMANFPTYDPAQFSKVSDAAVFTNPAVSEPLEIGSSMKTLTVAAGLNEGVIKPETTFYDPAKFTIDNETVRNVEEDGGAQTRSVADILRFSLNTGATWVLMQLGGGEINEQARNKWHDYLTNHYFFGQKTGVEQGYEAPGVVPKPNEGFGLNIKYANTAFGQGLTITALQMAAAFASTINGGVYYQPHLLETNDINSKIKRSDVVKPEISDQLRALHENTATKRYPYVTHDGYKVGGKTGTAEVASGGSYKTDVFNGTFVGYVGGDKPAYVIMVKVDEPRISGYAGSVAAAPLFGKVSNMLIDNFSIPRASQ